MGDIRRLSNPGSGSTKDTEFIQCVDGPEPQIHKLWCLGLDNITREVHPTTRVEVIAGTVGKFTANYLAENGRRIPIIGRLSINNSVHFWGLLLKFGDVDCCFFPTYKIPLIPLNGCTVGFPNRTG